MIKIVRKPLFCEKIRLRDGRKRLTVKLRIAFDDITSKFMKVNAEMKAAQELLDRDNSAENLNEFIAKTEAAYKVLFGDSYEKMLDFYEHNSLELLHALTPVVENEIAPKLARQEATAAIRSRK